MTNEFTSTYRLQDGDVISNISSHNPCQWAKTMAFSKF